MAVSSGESQLKGDIRFSNKMCVLSNLIASEITRFELFKLQSIQ